jgi:SAM-dependent methyltransferase
MKFVPITLGEAPDEIHTYIKQPRSWLSKARIANRFHWAALKYAATLVQPNVGTVVEIGCGEGYLIPTLSKYFDRVVAVDNSEKMLNVARSYFAFPNTAFVSDDITSPQQPELTATQYDWVICLEVLEHLPKWDVGVRNLTRLLRPGGMLLVSMPVEVGLPLLLKEIGRIASYGRGSGWKWNYFARKLFGSRFSVTRDDYGSHMGFDYREVLPQFRDFSMEVKKISFFPRYVKLRVYALLQKQNNPRRAS